MLENISRSSGKHVCIFHLSRPDNKLKLEMFSVVTVSDSRSSGLATDESGQLLKKLIEEAGYQVRETAVVPDERNEIEVCAFFLLPQLMSLDLESFNSINGIPSNCQLYHNNWWNGNVSARRYT